MSYLLDTCAVSEYASKSPSERVTAWLDGLDREASFLSALTVGELRQGISKLPASKRKRALEAWLNDRLLPRFEGRILVVDVPVMLVWGEMTAALSRSGRVLQGFDSLLAAQARYHDLAVVTRNVKDFAGTGVPVVNPWEE